MIRFFLLIFCILLSSCTSFKSSAYTWQFDLHEDANQLSSKHVLIENALRLNIRSQSLIPIVEFSGIAWDKDENLLYVVSDEGYLYHFSIGFSEEGKNLKLNDVTLVDTKHLISKKGKRLKSSKRDAEGLTLLNANNKLKGDSELVISFENKPRIEVYSTQGKKLRSIKLPTFLKDKENYRHNNNALESVALHPTYGLITAAELPLKNAPKKHQTIYSEKNKQWHFLASKTENSAITGLEVLPNGDILILERAYTNPLIPLVIQLSQLQLNTCNKNNICQRKTLKHFNAADGWNLDNFEGLAHIKDNHYLMISDKNQNPLQKSLLVSFQITQ